MSHARLGEAGKVKVGCLLSLVVIVFVVYYGLDFVKVRLRFFQMQDDVKTKASFAAIMDDKTIRRQLMAKADTLGLGLEARDWSIRRDPAAHTIAISATYIDSVVISLPGIHKTFLFTLTPQAANPY